MKLFLVNCLALLLTGYASAQCPIGLTSPSGLTWHSVSNKCMMCGTGLKDYAAARAACQAAGGDLSSILNAAEETFAESCSGAIGTAADANDVWFGLVMRNSGGLVYNWLDGSPEGTTLPPGVTATAPTAFTVNCFAIVAGGTPAWVDAGTPCDGLSNYVCSRAQATCPAAMGILGTTVVAYVPAGPPYYPGNVATYACIPGYAWSDSSGTTTKTCDNDGIWSSNEPLCDPVDCGPLVAPTHGSVAATSTTFNSVATYSCNPGYTLGDVSPSRTCGTGSSWSGSVLTCSAVDCGAPPAPENGDVSASATTYSSAATYTCNGNYQLKGDVTRTCLDSGTWSGSVPVCDNALAVGLGVSLGTLALLGIVAGMLYFMCRNPPSARAISPPMRAPIRPPYLRRPGPVVRPPPQPRRLY